MGSIVDISEILLEMGLSGSPTEEEQAIAQVSITKAEGAIKRFLKYDPVQAVRTEYYPQSDYNQLGRVGIWEVNNNDAYIRRLAEAVVDELQVQHLPVRATDSDGDNAIDLRIDFDGRSGTRSGSFDSDTQQTEGTDFWPNYDGVDSSGIAVCRDGIIRSEGRWPSVAGSVKIVYVAGYTATELHGQDTVVDASPIVDATIDEAIRRMKKAYSRMKKTGVGVAAGPFTSERLGDYSYNVASGIYERLVGTNWDILPETREKLSDFVNWGHEMAS